MCGVLPRPLLNPSQEELINNNKARMEFTRSVLRMLLRSTTSVSLLSPQSRYTIEGDSCTPVHKMPHNINLPLGIVILTLLVLVAPTSPTLVVDSSSIVDKVILGYQGWFTCAGDSKCYNKWSNSVHTIDTKFYFLFDIDRTQKNLLFIHDYIYSKIPLSVIPIGVTGPRPLHQPLVQSPSSSTPM